MFAVFRMSIDWLSGLLLSAVIFAPLERVLALHRDQKVFRPWVDRALWVHAIRRIPRTFHRFDRFLAGGGCGSASGKADAQVGDFLDQRQAVAGGQAKHVTAACLVGAKKMEVPVGHIDRTRRGRETKGDESALHIVGAWTTCWVLITSARGR